MTTGSLTRDEVGYRDLPRLLALMTGDEKHDLSAHSTLDVLWVLYDRVLAVSPEQVGDPTRDRFLLSKGHGPMAFYAVLAAKGFLTEADLRSFGELDSRLGHHPDRVLVPGVEISSGSLGHGLPLAVGTSLGLRAQGLHAPRVVVLIGDAELDEGSNHEAIAYAGAVGLDNLMVVVVDNGSATHGWRGGIDSRFAVAGWRTQVVDGRHHGVLADALADHRGAGPAAVVTTVEDKVAG